MVLGCESETDKGNKLVALVKDNETIRNLLLSGLEKYCISLDYVSCKCRYDRPRSDIQNIQDELINLRALFGNRFEGYKVVGTSVRQLIDDGVEVSMLPKKKEHPRFKSFRDVCESKVVKIALHKDEGSYFGNKRPQAVLENSGFRLSVVLGEAYLGASFRIKPLDLDGVEVCADRTGSLSGRGIKILANHVDITSNAFPLDAPVEVLNDKIAEILPTSILIPA